MDKKKNLSKSKITSFGRKGKTYRFPGASSAFPSDVLGSYTGTPLNGYGFPGRENEYPVQDADDL